MASPRVAFVRARQHLVPRAVGPGLDSELLERRILRSVPTLPDSRGEDGLDVPRQSVDANLLRSWRQGRPLGASGNGLSRFHPRDAVSHGRIRLGTDPARTV